jgi:hypothetical protein
MSEEETTDKSMYTIVNVLHDLNENEILFRKSRRTRQTPRR